MAIIIIRTLCIYSALILSLRLMGKRQLGEMEISELAVAVLVADIACIPLQDLGTPLMNGLIPLVCLLCCEVLITGIASKSIRLRYLLFGRPSVLIENGVINQKEMKANRFTLDELYEELRQQSITDISTVEQAVLETSGVLNVVLSPQNQPITAEQLGIASPESSTTTILINEGRILEENLKKIGKNTAWLNRILKKHHIKDSTDVYLLSVDQAGNTYIAKMEEPK